MVKTVWDTRFDLCIERERERQRLVNVVFAFCEPDNMPGNEERSRLHLLYRDLLSIRL
jgi:hypothetical protein